MVEALVLAFCFSTCQVKHFFKVGEPRSQGRAMLLSLSYQMAERLPGMAEVWMSMNICIIISPAIMLRFYLAHFRHRSYSRLQKRTVP